VENEILDLGKLTQYRLQRIDNTITNPSPAGTYGGNVQLDRAFNRIVGIGYFEIANGGLPNAYNVGAKTDRQTWIDPVNINAWNANSGVGVMQKYYKVNIPYASGDTFYTLITTAAATSAAFSGQMVLILQKDLVEQPR